MEVTKFDRPSSRPSLAARIVLRVRVALVAFALALGGRSVAAAEVASVAATRPTSPDSEPDAASAAATTILLVAPPPGLGAAIETALEAYDVNWIEVPLLTIERDAAVAAALEAKAARIVWVTDSTVVVFDAKQRTFDHRAAPEPPWDEAAAASVALTLKTMLRLPPPGTVEEPDPGAPPPRPRARRVRVEPSASLLTQLPLDGTVGAGLRLRIGSDVRSQRLAALGVGLELEFGLPRDDVGVSGLDATWRDVGARLTVSWRSSLLAEMSVVARGFAGVSWTRVEGAQPGDASVAFDTSDAVGGLGARAEWTRFARATPFMQAEFEGRTAALRLTRDAGQGGAAVETFLAPRMLLSVGVGVLSTF